MGKWKSILFIALAGLHISHLSAVSPDQTNLGILISENKENLNFINVCLSNLAPPQEDDPAAAIPPAPGALPVEPKKNLDSEYFRMIQSANQTDFSGNLWYLQSNYAFAFRQLRGAQGELKDIFEKVLIKYIEDTKTLLETAAPSIIRSDDEIAKSLLRFGFRDLRVGEDHLTIGQNSSPHQFRYKLKLFGEGISTLRRAKRFAILAMVYSKTPIDEKSEYQYRSLDDIKEAKSEEKRRAYDKTREALIYLIDNKKLDRMVKFPNSPETRQLDLLEQHDDNYWIITAKRLDLLHEANFQIKETEGAKRESIPSVPRFDETGKPIYDPKLPPIKDK